MFYRDVRVISGFGLLVDGRPPLMLSYRADGPGSDVRVYAAGRTHPASAAVIVHARQIEPGGAGLTDTFELRGLSSQPVTMTFGLSVECDFARLPALRYGLDRPPARRVEPAGDGCFAAGDGDAGLRVETDPAAAWSRPGVLSWEVTVHPGQPATVRIRYLPSWRGRPAAAAGTPGPRPGELRASSAAVCLEPAIRAGLADLAALQVTAPELGLSFCGAGAPWFLALYGRDSLITAWESLPAGTGLAMQALAGLARFQGNDDDPHSHEQPGRIPHEIRIGGTEYFGIPAGRPNYATVDASPLFVMVLAEAYRWGAEPDAVRDLLPAARAALEWCTSHTDAAGYLTYPGTTGPGLANQGWKDSPGAMTRSDGQLATPPIALAEVQAYFWAAHLALAELEQRLGVPDRAGPLRAAAASLRRSFHRDFWRREQGLVAMACEGDGRPLAVAASNMAHCLWTGLLDPGAAAHVAARLSGPDLCSGFGLRTLGSLERGYNPVSYHNGSVWPHDTAIAVAGLARYGYAELALRYTRDLLRAAAEFSFRLPEVFTGIGRDEWPVPVPYPLACRTQAWSAAAPLLLLRSLLRIDPDIPAGRVYLAPVLPTGVSVTVEQLSLGTAGALDLRVTGPDVEILSAPGDVAVIRDPGHREPPAPGGPDDSC